LLFLGGFSVSLGLRLLRRLCFFDSLRLMSRLRSLGCARRKLNLGWSPLRCDPASLN
jgi:hypothetical protein